MCWFVCLFSTKILALDFLILLAKMKESRTYEFTPLCLAIVSTLAIKLFEIIVSLKDKIEVPKSVWFELIRIIGTWFNGFWANQLKLNPFHVLYKCHSTKGSSTIDDTIDRRWKNGVSNRNLIFFETYFNF